MATPVLVVGHKNPDNDSIAAAIGYAYLKNELMKRNLADDPSQEEMVYIPCRLGPLPEESEAILDEYGVEPPLLISNVSARVKDVMSSPVISVSADAAVIEAGRLLRKHNVRALVVTDEQGKYQGLITTRMIAERYISAMDKASEESAEGLDKEAVAQDLLDSLTQTVSTLTDTDVLTLSEGDLLRDATDDLLSSTLREAVVLDDQGYAIGIVTRSDVTIPPRRNVILVDHNESSQAADGIDEAVVCEIIDHHRIGDISTVQPIRFLNIPVGSSATIVTMQFKEYNVEIPKPIAAVLLSAIMTDTVILKSPTATDVDQAQVEYLAGIIGVDPREFGMHVFECRGGDLDMDVKTLCTADSKEFKLPDGGTILIGQHETVTLQALMNREEEIRSFLKDLRDLNNYEFVLLLLTDIIEEGSTFIVEGDHHKVDRVFGIDSSKACWMPGVLSRKKQVAAPLLDA